MFRNVIKFLALSLSLSLEAKADVIYFTDLEGSRARLESMYVESGAFDLGSDQKYHLKPGLILIYGGDAPDRYLGSLWVIEELLRLQEENPETMISIGGNRDINKMRLTSELSEAALRRPPFLYPHLKPEEIQLELSQPPSRARRLQFIFEKTMGAPKAFELLRQELSATNPTITDEEIADIYLRTLSPGGVFAKWLSHIKLAFRIGNTVFVHGGLTPHNLGYVPGNPSFEPNLDKWIEKLNDWYQTEYKTWASSFLMWSGEGPRATEALLEYPMPKPGMRSNPTSTVTGRHVDLNNNPELPEPDVIAYLATNGVFREVVGHTPIGDTPIRVRTLDHSFESIFVDTSYSKVQNRPVWVRLKGPDYMESTTHGDILLSDGTWMPLETKTRLGTPTSVGLADKEGFRVIGMRGTEVIATKMENFVIYNRISGLDCLAHLK